MPTYFPENNTPWQNDDVTRSLQKINALVQSIQTGPANADVSGSGNVTSSAPLVIDTTGYGVLAFQTAGSMLAGNVQVSGSVDGTTFSAVNYTSLPSGTQSSTLVVATATLGIIDVSGFRAIRFSSQLGFTGPLAISYNLSGNSSTIFSAPLPAGANNIGAVTSNNALIERVSSFTRPADTTTYASGDLVANNTTAGSVVPLTFTTVTRSAGDSVRIERARINTSNALLTNASFRLHLFETTPVPTVGDNGAFNTAGVLATSGIDGYLGNFSITLSNSGTTGSSGRGVPDVGSAIIATPATGTSIFGLLEVTAAYVPVSGATFTVSLEGYRP
jgi:hypothetical protein